MVSQSNIVELADSIASSFLIKEEAFYFEVTAVVFAIVPTLLLT